MPSPAADRVSSVPPSAPLRGGPGAGGGAAGAGRSPASVYGPGDGDASSLITWFTSLPGVSQLLHAITTYDIGPVTRLLEQAAYLPLRIAASDSPAAADREGGYDDEVAAPCFEIVTEAAPPAGRLEASNRVGEPAALVRFRWRVIPDDYVGNPSQPRPLPAIPLLPERRQRIEALDWVVRFRGGASGYRAYGTGHTLPGAGAGPGETGVGLVLDVLEGYGQLAGLAATVVVSGSITAAGRLDLVAVTRVMDPAGGALSAPPAAAAHFVEHAAPPGVTYLAFLGQVDPEHPTTLRLSLRHGFLGSNVYERLRAATLDFDVGGRPDGGELRGGAIAGPVVGWLSARLSFDPVSLCPTLPVQTRRGVFEIYDQAGNSVGTILSDMTEGRAFPTRVPGRLLPFYRFGGFGPIAGTGEFGGARGVMTLNAVISVEPRTLSNLYVLRLEDPDGRYRAAAGAGAVTGAAGGRAGRQA